MGLLRAAVTCLAEWAWLRVRFGQEPGHPDGVGHPWHCHKGRADTALDETMDFRS